MKRALSALLALSMCVPLLAVEVNLEIIHYPVVIEDGQSIDDAILTAAKDVPNLAQSLVSDQHHAVSSYVGSVTLASLAYHYEASSQRCVLTDLVVSLNGEMVLPTLFAGSSEQHAAFTQEYRALKAHEWHHQTLWQQALLSYEERLKDLSLADDEMCSALFHEINQEMGKTLVQIEAVNLAYDCDSYGADFNLSLCHAHSDDEGD